MVLSRRKFFSRNRPGATLHDHFAATQTRRVRPGAELKRMKAERNDPSACKRSEMFAIVDPPNANIARCFVDINFSLSWRNFSPLWIGPLRRDEVRKLWHCIEYPHGSMRREIRREKAKMKIRTSEGCVGQRLAKQRFVRAIPEHAVVQERDWRMKFGEDPSVISTRYGFR